MLRGLASNGSTFGAATPHRGVNGPAAPAQLHVAGTSQRSFGRSAAALVLASADCEERATHRQHAQAAGAAVQRCSRLQRRSCMQRCSRRARTAVRRV